MTDKKFNAQRLVIAMCLLSLPLISGWRVQKNSGDAREPGLYSFTGWNDSTWGIDINGEVGHTLFVNGPTADCHPSGNWQMNRRIASGSLPPGLTLGSAPSHITGIPMERGHWIVKLETYDVQCEGSSYKGFEQELRFHITGSGAVHN